MPALRPLLALLLFAALPRPFGQLQGERSDCSAAILAAARYGDEAQLLRSLQTESANCIDDSRRTPLHWAARYGQMEAALKLLAAGGLFERDIFGRSPLHEAAMAGQMNMTSLLLQAGAYIELDDYNKKTPLHLAAFNGHDKLIEFLLSRGAVIDCRNGADQTPLHYTSQWDPYLNSTVMLISRGAELEPRDVVGFTPLHYACHTDQKETVYYLIDQGADLFSMDDAGWNPLVHAAAEDHAELVDWLIQKMLKPKTYPTPDPSNFIQQDLAGSFLGLPAWLVAIALICGCSACIVCPAVHLMKRFSTLRKPYLCDTSDAALEEFINSIWADVGATRASQKEITEGWDRLPTHSLKDLHRVKSSAGL